MANSGYITVDSYSAKDNTEDNNEGKLFVGGLAWESSEESIKQYFEQFGPVEHVNLKKNKEDMTKHRGFAFVKFKYGADAEDVLRQKDAHVIDGAKVDAKSACPQGVKPEQRTKKIFVGGLQAETTEEKLRDYFGEFGEIQNNIEFAVDHNTKKRRGFCFIEFSSEGIVDRIVKQKYHEVAGKRLETKRALTKQQQQELGLSDGKKYGGAPIMGLGGYPGAMQALTGAHLTQPVIYIHPDSLSTAYPLAGLAGLTSYPSIATGGAPSYTSALETLYTPYSGGNRDVRHQTKASSGRGSSSQYSSIPYGKSRSSGMDPYRKY